MKYMIIGLGELGVHLAKQLTAQGNSVTAVDHDQQIIERYKQDITTCVCLDGCDALAMRQLPMRHMDVVVIAIGHDVTANIMATALVKKLGAKKIVGRRIDALHQTVLEAMNVDDIICPEVEAANRWANRLI